VSRSTKTMNKIKFLLAWRYDTQEGTCSSIHLCIYKWCSNKVQ